MTDTLHFVTFETNLGQIKLELNETKAPITTKNFLDYVKSGHFDGTIFHRVIPDFMIQGGGFDEKMKEKKTNDCIQNECHNGLQNLTGSIAMARTSAPHSASGQFFINLKDNLFLDPPSKEQWGYAVFGRVVDGMDIVNEIAKVETGDNGHHSDVPVAPIVIQKAYLHGDNAQLEA